MKLRKRRRDTADEDRRDQVARPSSPLPTLREFVYLERGERLQPHVVPRQPAGVSYLRDCVRRIWLGVGHDCGSRDPGARTSRSERLIFQCRHHGTRDSAPIQRAESLRRLASRVWQWVSQSLVSWYRRPVRHAQHLRHVTEIRSCPSRAESDVLSTLQSAQRAVRVSSLRRGDLPELPIALSAHPVFAITTSVQEIGNLLEKHPSLTGGMDTSTQLGLEAASSLRQLMTDLVPIEGCCSTTQPRDAPGRALDRRKRRARPRAACAAVDRLAPSGRRSHGDRPLLERHHDGCRTPTWNTTCSPGSARRRSGQSGRRSRWCKRSRRQSPA